MRIKVGRDKLLLLGFFLAVILSGSALLSIPGMYRDGSLSYVDALFTSTSAVCVTGLITVDTARFSRLGQCVIMALIQIGGLGIITFVTLFLAMPRHRISIVNKGVVSEYSVSEVEYRPRAIVRAVVKYTVIFECVGAVLFAIGFGRRGIPLFDALFHSVSAFCNAGFSTFSNNLEDFVLDPLVNLVTVSLIVSGGIGFVVIRDLRQYFTGRRTHLSYHSRIALTTTASLIVAGTLLVLLLESGHAFAGFTFFQKLIASLFQAVTPRTAGFDTVPQSGLSHGTLLVTMFLMFVGASPSSTGGGIKTTTFFVLVATAFRYGDSSDSIRIDRRSILPRTVYKAVGVVVKAIIIILVTAVALSVFEHGAGNPVSLVEGVFESISAFGTVGLSMGITGSLQPASKLVLILTMFIGRVGLFAFALPKSRKDMGGYATMPSADILI